MKGSRVERWEITMENIEMEQKELKEKRRRKIKEKGTDKEGERKEGYKNGRQQFAKRVSNFLTAFIQTLSDVLYGPIQQEI